jgi:hypothetical protein
MTSCNRIKQTLLSLSLNAQIIHQPFSVVIVDNSTPDLLADTQCEQHQIEDPYNVVKPHNYCNDVNLLYNAHQYFPNIEEFKIIHTRPRLAKQRGDSTSLALGFMQAALMGNRHTHKQNYALKLTGTSILKYDVLGELPTLLANHDVVTWTRANIGGEERTTRIMGCKPEILVSIFAREGWLEYVDDSTGILEQRYARIINRNIPDRINYTGNDENGLLLEGGVAMQQEYGRERITQFIQERNIDSSKTPWLQEFVNGSIW